MATKKDVTVQLRAENRQLLRALKESTRAMKGAMSKQRRELKRTNQTWAKAKAVAVGSLTAMATSFAGGRLAGMLRDITSEMDKLAKSADGLGLTVDQFTALSGQAVESGLQQEKFAKGLAKLNKVVIDASYGLTTYTRAFDGLGINIYRADGRLKDSMEVFFDLKKAVDKYGASQQVIASMMDIFGARIGPGMVRMLQDVAGSMDEVVKRGESMGVVIDEHAIRKFEEMQNRSDVLGQRVRALSTNVEGLAGAWLSVKESLVDAWAAYDKWIEGNRKEGGGQKASYAASLPPSARKWVGGGYGGERTDYNRGDVRRGFAGWVRDRRASVTTAGGGKGQLGSSTGAGSVTKELKVRQSEWSRQQLEGLEKAQKMMHDQEIEYYEMEEAERERQLQKRIEEVKAFDAALDRSAEATEEFSRTLDSNLSSAFDGVVSGTTKVKDAFSSMMANILAELTQRHVTGPLASAISGGIGSLFGGGGGGAGFLGSLFGGSSSSTLPSPVISTFPMRAHGGPGRAGQSYVTGENGREIFTPDRDGRFMPHWQSQMAAQPAGDTINVTYNIAPGVSRAELAPLLADTTRGAVERVRRERLRGGSMKQAFSG